MSFSGVYTHTHIHTYTHTHTHVIGGRSKAWREEERGIFSEKFAWTDFGKYSIFSSDSSNIAFVPKFCTK